MKAVVVSGPNEFGCKEIEKTVCPEGGLLLKVELAALCGSDLRKLRSGTKKYPVILGHEVVGTIVESKDPTNKYKIGTSVVPKNSAPCQKCYFCKNGLSSSCPNRVVQALGYDAHPDHQGGFQEYMPICKEVVQNGILYEIPEGYSSEDALMIEPYTNVLASHDLLPLDKAKTALVIGAGPVGAIHVSRLMRLGIRCSVADLNRGRLEQMKRVVLPDSMICSSETDLKSAVMEFTEGRGADIVIVACSSNKAAEQALELLNFEGHLLLFGGLPAANPYVKFDGNLIHYNKLTIHGTYGCQSKHWDQAYDMFLQHEITGSGFLDFLKLEQFNEAVEMMEKGTVMKPAFRL